LHTRIPSLSNSPRMRSAPKTAILACHLLDQCNRLWRELRLSRISLRLVLPEQVEKFPMPPKQGLRLYNEEYLPPGPNHPRATRTKRNRSVFLQAGRLTCRCRMMSCCRNNAFSTSSSDFPLARSVIVPSRKEVERGFIQRIMPSESA
jgi:hypothetical protein